MSYSWLPDHVCSGDSDDRDNDDDKDEEDIE